MEKRKNNLMFLILSVLVPLSFSCSKNQGEETIKPAMVLSDDHLGTTALPPSAEQIERLAWCGIQWDQITKKRFEEFKKCGLTINYTSYQNANQLESVLNFSQEVGIKTILQCQETYPNQPGLAETINRYKNHPALYGYAIMDEPQRNPNNFTGTIDEAIAHGKAVRALDPNEEHILYITNNYIPLADIEYLDAGIDRKILSFDYYPTVPYEISPGIYNSWFLATENQANHAKRIGKKWWGFAVTAKHNNYPTATIFNLRAQVYVNLAYGAQGIEYFTYSPPKGSNDYTNTPVDAAGDTTSFFAQLRIINTEIKNLSFVFANSTVEWTRHYNYSKDDPAVIPTVTSKEPVVLPSQVKKVYTSLPVIVALLKKGSNKYFVIVNRSFTTPCTAELEFDGSVKRILKTGVKVEAEKEILIRPGDALIYNWQQ